MGNYRFRLSDMMPNAWFYKLKDMNRVRNHHKIITNKQSSASSLTSSSLSSVPVQQINHPSEKQTKQLPHLSEQRKSYYITRDLNLNQDNLVPTEPPRKSSRRRRSSKKNQRPEKQTGPRLVSASVSAGCSCKATMESVWAKPGPDFAPEDDPTGSSSEPDSVLTEFGSDRGLTPDTFDGRLSWSSSCKCRTENDIVIDMVDDDNKPFNDLPPIITKKNDDEPTKIKRTSAELSYGSLLVKVVKEDFLSSAAAKPAASPAVRRIFSGNSSSPGVKLRTNTPRILNRKIQGGRKSTSSNSGGGQRRSVSESFAVVKSSKDPRRDFRESMVEMILENNIRASKDLEELLACYLSLNSDEYHDIIINVFKQIWFDFIRLRDK